MGYWPKLIGHIEMFNINGYFPGKASFPWQPLSICLAAEHPWNVVKFSGFFPWSARWPRKIFHGQVAYHGQKIGKKQQTSIFYNNNFFHGHLADHGKGVSPEKSTLLIVQLAWEENSKLDGESFNYYEKCPSCLEFFFTTQLNNQQSTNLCKII